MHFTQIIFCTFYQEYVFKVSGAALETLRYQVLHCMSFPWDRIVVNPEHFEISIDQSKYIQDILDKFDMGTSHPVGTPMIKRLSVSEKGEELSNQDKAKYRVMVGSLLYLACWTWPDIAVASRNCRVLFQILEVRTCKQLNVL